MRKEVVLKMVSLHVLLVERGTIGNANRVMGVVLDVVNMYTR